MNRKNTSKKEYRIGQTKVMNNGMECTIIAYRNAKDIDVCFEDGAKVFNKSYKSFEAGTIKYQKQQNEDNHTDSIHLVDTTKELIFEGSLTYQRGETYYYYVERNQSQYYFKYGISMLGVQIQRQEHNRLNIVIHDETEYIKFKQALFDETGRYRWMGANTKYDGNFCFLDEPIVQTCSKDTTKFQVPFHTILKQYFEYPTKELLKNNKGKIIDSFELNTATHTVIHDTKIKGEVYTAETEMTEPNNTVVKFQFMNLNQELSASQQIQLTHITEREQYDLLREALYVYNNQSYPQQMIVVNGWTAKDLIESKHKDFIDAYDILTLMRVDANKAHEDLKRILFFNYDKLFDKEMRRIYQPRQQFKTATTNTHNPLSSIEDKDKTLSDMLMDIFTTIGHSPTAPISQTNPTHFLSEYTIPIIQQQLQQYIVGQEELVTHVAMFIYYHMLRQTRNNLGMRPLLISGPSGSGKTEIWRVAKKLYSKYLQIEIVDGSTITQEGWNGQRKLSSVLQSLNTAAILVVDEFDKLAKPSYSKGGDNVSQRIQSEFLKLLEGDFTTVGYRRDDVRLNYDTTTLGLVMVGAFEGIRSEKENENDAIGFIRHTNSAYDKCVVITDEDLIEFGVMPEIAGRIADKCTTNKLTAAQYLEIIRNQFSRVNVLIQELEALGIKAEEAITDDRIIELAEQSQSNMMGVRWVSSQIETELLKLLLLADLRQQFVAPMLPENHCIDEFDF